MGKFGVEEQKSFDFVEIFNNNYNNNFVIYKY